MSSKLARIAYEAYGRVTDGKNFRGDPIPAWDDLPEKVRDAWDAAVGAAIDAWGAD